MSETIKLASTTPKKVTPPQLRNPTGKGGFQERPEQINRNGWQAKNTISYQYTRFMGMSTAELRAWAKTPETERTVAMDLAFNRVIAARKSLPDLKEITDRTEGKAKEFIDHTSGGEAIVFGNMVPRNADTPRT